MFTFHVIDKARGKFRLRPGVHTFDFTVALDFYEAVVAAAEEDGEGVVFTATCHECRAETEDPFLQLMNKVQARINKP